MAAACRLLVNVVIVVLVQQTVCWDSEDLELFDLVEEVNQNFYDVLAISQSASSAEVRKAYRKLSLQVHPDKNKAPDAEVKFRQLVAIYEVLKDEDKRQRYNQVLVEGLPDWRQPVYYYRRVRKLSLTDLLLMLTTVFTIGQYLVMWAIYVERRLTLEDNFDAMKKKKRKRKGEEGEMEELKQEVISSIPKPRLLDLWPFTLTSRTVSTLSDLPVYIAAFRQWWENRKAKKKEEEEEEEQEEPEVVRKPKRKRVDVIPEYSPEMYEVCSPVSALTSTEEDSATDQLDSQNNTKDGEWSEEELILFSKAVNKFPGGTHRRWEKISAMVGRSVEEVTAKAKHIRGCFNPGISVSAQGSIPKNKKVEELKDDMITKVYVDSQLSSQLNQEETDATRAASKTSGASSQTSGLQDPESEESRRAEDTDSWNQIQQQSFEWALRQFPKGTDKRWDKIAEHIPGKSKEECVARFKHLAEVVKKKKEAKTTGSR